MYLSVYRYVLYLLYNFFPCVSYISKEKYQIVVIELSSSFRDSLIKQREFFQEFKAKQMLLMDPILINLYPGLLIASPQPSWCNYLLAV